MAAVSASPEPRTLEEMHQRFLAARARADAAARQHRAQAAQRTRVAQEAAAKKEIAAKVREVLAPDWIDRQPKRIIARVAAEHRVGVDDIIGPSKHCEVVTARYAAIQAVAEAHPNLSGPQLGQIFGGRDHTTILYALGRLPTKIKPPVHRPDLSPMEEIVHRVADEHGVTVSKIRGRSTSGGILAARHAAMIALAKADPDLSSVAIGRLVNRDHTVVLTVLRRAGVRSEPARKPSSPLAAEGSRRG